MGSFALSKHGGGIRVNLASAPRGLCALVASHPSQRSDARELPLLLFRELRSRARPGRRLPSPSTSLWVKRGALPIRCSTARDRTTMRSLSAPQAVVRGPARFEALIQQEPQPAVLVHLEQSKICAPTAAIRLGLDYRPTRDELRLCASAGRALRRAPRAPPSPASARVDAPLEVRRA